MDSKSLAGLIFLAATALPAAASAEDVVKPAWFAGQNVCLRANLPAFAGGSGPSGPTPTTADDVRTFLVGAMDASRPYGAEQPIWMPNPNGGPPVFVGTVPAHDDTFETFPSRPPVRDGFGYWVVRGPQGAEGVNVRTRPAPAGSFAGGPLAYEIRVGHRWVKLNHAVHVAMGLHLGLLRLVDVQPSPWGGTVWASWGACP